MMKKIGTEEIEIKLMDDKGLLLSELLNPDTYPGSGYYKCVNNGILVIIRGKKLKWLDLK